MPSIAEARTFRHPVRMAHLGLGHFHRAHQAWYTQHADAVADAADGWGIAAFSGRSPRAADALAEQDCVYSLITRAADGDGAEIMQSVSEAHDGGGALWERTLADPGVVILTVTVTERGYDLAAGGDGRSESAGARIVRGLQARARASAERATSASAARRSASGQRSGDAPKASTISASLCRLISTLTIVFSSIPVPGGPHMVILRR